MFYYDRISLSWGTDPAKSNSSYECIVCYYWLFKHGFEFQDSVCNLSYDFAMLCLNISDIVIITVKVLYYSWH